MYKFKQGEMVKKLSYEDMRKNVLKMKSACSTYDINGEYIFGMSKSAINGIPNTLTVVQEYLYNGIIYYDFKETGWSLYECMICKLNPLLIELE